MRRGDLHHVDARKRRLGQRALQRAGAFAQTKPSRSVIWRAKSGLAFKTALIGAALLSLGYAAGRYEQPPPSPSPVISPPKPDAKRKRTADAED